MFPRKTKSPPGREGAGSLDAPPGDPALFLAKIDDVDGAGATATYGFVEQQISDAGVAEDRTSGRVATTAENPARYAGGGTLAVDDLVLVRRSVRDVNEYDVVAVLNGVVTEDTFQFPLTYAGTIDPDTCTVTLTVATWQTVTVRAVGLEIEVS